MRWAGHVARVAGMRNAYNILIGKPEGKRPIGRIRRRLEVNVRMDIREIVWEDGVRLIWLKIGISDGNL
jgi:hypothetical protein